MPKDKAILNYFHLHFIVFIWGFTAVLGKLITLDALALVWYRMLFASIIMLVYILIVKIPFRVSKKILLGFLLAGFVIALHWLTFFKSIKESNISVALACFSTGAFFTSLLEPIFYKRKVIAYEIIFGVIVIISLYMIFRVQGNYLYGIVLGLISAFLSALFSIINGKFAKKHDASVISFYEIFGGVIFLTICLLYNQSFTSRFFQVTKNDLIWLFILSSICTAYAFIASVGVMKYLSPYTVMLTINLEPIYGIILALLVFNENEKMSPQFYLGAVIIIGTVIMNGYLKNKKKAVLNNC
jgi:drug/metabolite transporter (DMT)-like permease